MRHSAALKRRRQEFWEIFLENVPPKMPKDTPPETLERIIAYAWLAFVSGYNAGANDFKKDRVQGPTGRKK